MTVKCLLELFEKSLFILSSDKRLEKNKDDIINNIIFVFLACPIGDGDEFGFPCICVKEKTIDKSLSNKRRYEIRNMFKNNDFVALTCDSKKVAKKEECITFSKLIEVLKNIEDKEKEVYVETFTKSGEPQYTDIINVWPYLDPLFCNVSEYAKKIADEKYFMSVLV